MTPVERAQRSRLIWVVILILDIHTNTYTYIHTSKIISLICSNIVLNLCFGSLALCAGGEVFTSNGLMVTQRNYLDVYRYEKWSGYTIPVFQKHNSFRPTDLQMTSHSTAAPPLLSESNLIGLMDRHGIGPEPPFIFSFYSLLLSLYHFLSLSLADYSILKPDFF